jgi:integrase/recombinase XerC/integrase/recombinase XerD
MLNLMIRTGLRTIEVARANIGDIRNEGTEKVLWVKVKGRVVQMNMF